MVIAASIIVVLIIVAAGGAAIVVLVRRWWERPSETHCPDIDLAVEMAKPTKLLFCGNENFVVNIGHDEFMRLRKMVEQDGYPEAILGDQQSILTYAREHSIDFRVYPKPQTLRQCYSNRK